MKKFDFFSMLFVALLSFLGTEVHAQYKSVDASRVAVNAVLQNIPNWKNVTNPAAPNPNAAALTVESPVTMTNQMIDDMHKRKFGSFLVKEFDKGTGVAAALDKLTVLVNETSQTVPARALKMAEAETFYRNLLKI